MGLGFPYQAPSQTSTRNFSGTGYSAEERIKTREVLTIIENGRDLIEAKEALGHGNFMTWTKQVFPMFNHRTINGWMNAAERYGGKLEFISNLNDTVMMLLAAPSTPDEVREEVEARALAGEKITVAEVQELKREAARAKDEAERLKAEREEWIEMAQRAADREQTIEDLHQRLDSEAEERRKLTDQREPAGSAAQRPRPLWQRLLRWR